MMRKLFQRTLPSAVATAAAPAMSLLLLAACGCSPGKDETQQAAKDKGPDTSTTFTDPRSLPPLSIYENVNYAAEKAWSNILEAARPKAPPEEWAGRRPSSQEAAAWRRSNGDRAAAAAARARDFYTQYPKHPRTRDAYDKEVELLGLAVQLGATNNLPRLKELEAQRMKDPTLSEDQRYSMRAKLVERVALSFEAQGPGRIIVELEKGARELLKDFPDRSEPYDWLAVVAANSEPEKASQVAKEVVESRTASAEARAKAGDVLKRLAVVGTTPDMKFKALDGSEIDLARLRGNVVLVYFWAAWAGPCIEELATVNSVYDQFHSQGLEIIGISLDQEKEVLEAVLREHQVKWPQYFDGQGWQNAYARRYGITSLPAMWLVDKKGVVREANARVDLEKKVRSFLAP